MLSSFSANVLFSSGKISFNLLTFQYEISKKIYDGKGDIFGNIWEVMRTFQNGANIQEFGRHQRTKKFFSKVICVSTEIYMARITDVLHFSKPP